MDEQKKTTTLYASVGADAGQPFVKDNTEIVSNSIEENNASEEEMYALLRKMNQLNDPHYLHTISLNELLKVCMRDERLLLMDCFRQGFYPCRSTQNRQIFLGGTDCLSCKHRAKSVGLCSSAGYSLIPRLGR